MPRSKPMQRNLGRIIGECRHSCPVRNLEELMPLIPLAHPPSRKLYSISSIQKRKGQKINSILCLIPLYLLLFPGHQALFQHLPSYLPFFHQSLAHPPRLLVSQRLHQVRRLFLQQSTPNLPADMIYLWARHNLSPLAVMLAVTVASFGNASTMQDQRVVCSLLILSGHRRGVRPLI